MKNLLLVAMLCACGAVTVAQAADSDCAARAADKKLSGAAKTSFLKKCEKDAAAAAKPSPADACAAKAAEKKLAGAAKTSFVKKCEKDAAAAK